MDIQTNETWTFPDDKLTKMLEVQQLAQLCRGYDFKKMSDVERVDYIKKHAQYLSVELGEFLVELPGFKDWKKYSPEHILANPAAKEELIDVLHFFLNICLALGLTASDIYEQYMQKAVTNTARLQDIEHYKRDVD